MRTLTSELVLPHHTLRNRVIMGSMHTGFEEHPEGAEHLAAFYAERAKNGVALIITGGIGPNSDDHTREAVAAALGVGLRHVPSAEVALRERFERIGRAEGAGDDGSHPRQVRQSRRRLHANHAGPGQDSKDG